MTAPVDRLAAIIAEQMRADGWTCEYHEPTSREGECSGCDESLTSTARATAAVIAAAGDLAVIEVDEPSENTERHVAYGDFRRQGGWPATLDRRSGTVYFEDTDSGESRNLRAKTAVKYATNILAAAKAAEGVSDR